MSSDVNKLTNAVTSVHGVRIGHAGRDAQAVGVGVIASYEARRMNCAHINNYQIVVVSDKHKTQGPNDCSTAISDNDTYGAPG